jgi:hypothetical protein
LVAAFGLLACDESEVVLDNLVYQENFDNIATNGWNDTSDDSPVPSGYSVTAVDGSYVMTNQNEEYSFTTSPVVASGTAVSLSVPYRLTVDVSFPTGGVTAIAWILFNRRTWTDSGSDYEVFDCLMLTGDGEYCPAHCYSVDGDITQYDYYMSDNAWGESAAIDQTGEPFTVEIVQKSAGMSVYIAGQYIGYYPSNGLKDSGNTMALAMRRDESAGTASVSFDNVMVYQ